MFVVIYTVKIVYVYWWLVLHPSLVTNLWIHGMNEWINEWMNIKVCTCVCVCVCVCLCTRERTYICMYASVCVSVSVCVCVCMYVHTVHTSRAGYRSRWVGQLHRVLNCCGGANWLWCCMINFCFNKAKTK